MLKSLLHIDSIDGIMNYDTILKTYHAYNTNIKINQSVTNIKEISLKSLELPIFFNNIRSANNSNLFTFTFSYSSFNNIIINVTITELNYITITSLITAINSAISSAISAYSGLSIVLSVYNTNYIRITHNCISLTLGKSLLINNILGFNSGTYNTLINSTNFYSLNIDNYIMLYITNLSGSDAITNGKIMTFKLILPNTNGSVLFLGEHNSFNQTISITDPFYVLNSLNIMILDRFNFPINGGNAHYSFTLGISYDKTNEKIRRFI